MAYYVGLLNFTDQGIKAVKETTKREKALRDLAKGMGVTVKESLWTLGRHDVVLMLEAANDETITALMLKLGSLGNVKSETLRAFNASEMEGILSKV